MTSDGNYPLDTYQQDQVNIWTKIPIKVRTIESVGAKWRPLCLLSNMKNVLHVTQNVASKIHTILSEKPENKSVR